MSIDWIRKSYRVPAKVGGRVEYTGEKIARRGVITGQRGPHLLIRLDGEEQSSPYHPTWELRYLDAPPPIMREVNHEG